MTWITRTNTWNDQWQ